MVTSSLSALRRQVLGKSAYSNELTTTDNDDDELTDS